MIKILSWPDLLIKTQTTLIGLQSYPFYKEDDAFFHISLLFCRRQMSGSVCMFCVQVVQIIRSTLKVTRCPISAWLWWETSACCPAKTLLSSAMPKSPALSSTYQTSSTRWDSSFSALLKTKCCRMFSRIFFYYYYSARPIISDFVHLYFFFFMLTGQR